MVVRIEREHEHSARRKWDFDFGFDKVPTSMALSLMFVRRKNEENRMEHGDQLGDP